MLTVSYLTEDVVTRRDVGGGIGSYIGKGLGSVGGSLIGSAVGGPVGFVIGQRAGSLAGNGLGYLLGRSAISNPDKPADFSKASHRFGHLAKYGAHPLAMAGDALIPGLGASGAALASAVSDEGAKKMGYQTTGKVGSAIFGPLAGLVSPDKIAKNKK